MRPSLKPAARIALLGAMTAAMLVPQQAPGTVAEQRARLPPAAECESDVEGIWKAHIYEAHRTTWHAFTLEIRKAADSETRLVGKIRARGWEGTAKEEEPGPCKGRLHFLVSMDAEGSAAGGQISFRGTRYKLDDVVCGRFFGYNLDHFSGKIDPRLQEFQSKNNDGGEMINIPIVFRRVGCFEDEPPPEVKIVPPPLFQERRNGGCDCGRTPGA